MRNIDNFELRNFYPNVIGIMSRVLLKKDANDFDFTLYTYYFLFIIPYCFIKYYFPFYLVVLLL